MSAVIDFTPDGQAQAMHRDEFDLGFLGAKSITRASDIKFNETTQLWDIWLMASDPDYPPELCDEAKGLPAYDVARSVEVAWLDRCRLVGLDPVSVDGKAILNGIRRDILL